MAAQKRLEEIPIRVHGKNIAVTDALRRYLQAKLGRLPRYFDQVQDAQVVLSVARDRNRGHSHAVEVTVWCGGLVLRAEEASEDMYASIDGVAEKLERQIEKYRSRMIEKRRLDESRRRRRTQQSAEAALRTTAAEEVPPTVVRTKRFPMKPMTVEDAILQMELLGHAFFVFRHAGTEKINVLYRRRDGNFGLIEAD
ncbi:MAG: ribosome-associated translation inhibitor RaiA [Armatimonadota bacterium]|nr:ribosome-associated translation inhibitor RaiA [Armatimonadota bacterium]MDR7520493.1 ribosome-associated translation inhibitor RaiA [Armatimonadota bacterium]MDR7550513.1 ribosome-associated translation inhibitor RaiA [Armatimonadota bacterium]